MKLVDVFVIGAPKCGSTLLYEYFSRFLDVSVGEHKEINFFSADWLVESNSYYDDLKTFSQDRYHENYNGSAKLWIDFSVSYFLCDGIEERIHQYNPRAKIIILTRDPIRRALSHYEMDKRLGCHSLSLKAVLDAKSSFAYNQVVKNSQYCSVKEKFTTRFGSDNVFCGENVHVDTVLADLCQFLGLEYVKNDLGVVNEAIYPAFDFIYVLIKFFSRNAFFQFILKRRIVIFILKKMFFRKSRPKYLAEDLDLLSRCIHEANS